MFEFVYSKYEKKRRDELDDQHNYFKNIFNYGKAFKSIRDQFA